MMTKASLLGPMGKYFLLKWRVFFQKSNRCTKMALSISIWASYVEGQTKLTRKSEAAVESDRVLRFIYDREMHVVTATVQASMKDTSYNVQIFLDADGTVNSTSCQCPMGEYKCHHIAAALLFGYKRASKTDVRCSWLKHPKSAPPKSTVTMSDLFPCKQTDYRALKREMTDDDRSFLYKELGQLGRFTGLHWILSPEPAQEKPPVPLVEDLLTSSKYLSAENSGAWLLGECKLSQESIVKTAFVTSGQRENGMWAAVRKLRFTASNFGPILAAANRNRLTPSLQKRLLSAYNLEKRPAIQWGITHESHAKTEYCRVGQVEVIDTGLWLHQSGILGASPDGIVQGSYKARVYPQRHGQPFCQPDICEIKCPYSAREGTVTEACSNQDFFLEKRTDGGLALKEGHDYWQQIQGQLYMTGTYSCDLVVWTPKDMQVIRILKDDSWASNIPVMISFYLNHFLPSFSKTP